MCWLVKNYVAITRRRHRTSMSCWHNGGASKENLYFDNQSSQVVFLSLFFSSWCFLKEIEDMFSVFLLSYSNTCESLGELEKAVEKHATPTAFLILPNFHSCFYNSIETWYMCFISEVKWSFGLTYLRWPNTVLARAFADAN